MRPNVWLPTNGIVFHSRRDCRAITGAPRLESVAPEARRLAMFDPCPRCLADAPRRQRPVATSTVLEHLRDRPPSTIERLRTEARRRGVTYVEWAARYVDTTRVIDLVDAERVIDLTTTRQSVSVTS